MTTSERADACHALPTGARADGHCPPPPHACAPRGRAVTRRRAVAAAASVALLSAPAALAARLARAAEAADDAPPSDDPTPADAPEAQAPAPQDVQARIDDLGAQCEELGRQLAGTLAAMEGALAEIARTQAQMDAVEADLAAIRSRITVLRQADGASSSEADASAPAVAIVPRQLSSGRTVYLVMTLDEQLADLIGQEQTASDDLAARRAELQDQYAALNDLREQQRAQLADVQARQDETYRLLQSLDDQSRELAERQDADLGERAQEAADDAASDRARGGYGGSSAAAVIQACDETPSPGPGYCAAWVADVFVNAGIGYFGGNACDMYASWCLSSDPAELQPGMIVAVSTHDLTAAGRIYGHVGVYVGDGVVMDNVGYIRATSFDEWVATYGTTVEPRWGWLGGVELA